MFFTVKKIEKQLKDIRSAVFRETCAIPHFKFLECENDLAGDGALWDAFLGSFLGAECPEYDDRKWRDFKVGEYWGGYDYLAWFRTWLSIPPHFRDKKLALRFLVGPRDGGGSTAETLLYVNGSPLQALDVWHPDAWLPPELAQQERIFLALKAWSGVLEVPEKRHFILAELAWVDEACEGLVYRVDTLIRAAKTLEENDLRRTKILQALEGTFHRIDFIKPRSSAFYASVVDARDYLNERIIALGEIEEIKPRVIGIGHAHIDLAWLWRVRHSREKAARTFTTALHLMRQYPEYRFMHSSPQLYQYIKTDYPEIYERVKERIAAGQWEITGGMWVEADTNLPGGESLIRQFLLGKRFIRKEFGVETNILWLPDVFGYSWALPQIIKKCGLKYFLTSKISWSQFNRFPYDTFHWRGIDGSEILTHFVTTPEENSPFYTYNGQLLPEEVKGSWDHYRQKEINEECLTLFGWGDGGGGPTKEMLESARALHNLPGIPKVELGKAEPFFERLDQSVANKGIPVWDGELYLEYHRGTYTSQAYNKRLNRQSEVLFHNAEWLSAVADLLAGLDQYPARELLAGWELILLNQFHDILPGSSIRQVYEDSRQDYENITRIGEQALGEAGQVILDRFKSEPGEVVVFNPLSWQRDGLIEVPWSEQWESMLPESGDRQPAQIQINGEKKDRTVLLQVSGIPSLGYQAYPWDRLAGGLENEEGQALWPGEIQSASESPPAEDRMVVTPKYLENPFYRITFNSRGQIVSLWDKRCEREVLASGEKGNVFQAFEDKPMAFDAWDIDIYYQEKAREVQDLVDVRVDEIGPLRGSLRLSWRFYDSWITQRILIYRDSPRIDFQTQVDWSEQQVLLKVAFPVSVRSTRATYDIQFGNIERPTHWNTSWDYARFETVGHKWVDLSEGNYGVALLNDCKYGHDVKDHTIRLTLIKSAIAPDKTADQCRHNFTYSLFPHAGDWRNSRLVNEAYELNYPLFYSRSTQTNRSDSAMARALPKRYQFAEIDADHVILETVKKAEDEDAWIIRVYEYKQCHNSKVNIRFGHAVRKAVECNMVEEDEKPAAYTDRGIRFSVSPYEIKTFKVWFLQDTD